MNTTRLIALAAMTVSLAANASATIIDGYSFTTPFDNQGNGEFIQLFPVFGTSSPSNTVGNDNFQSPNLWAFDEDQNVAVGPDGLDPEKGDFLAAGTIVASHYVFFDPVTKEDGGGYHQVGWVLFDANILAIFTSATSLLASDYLANTGVTYLNPDQRGLENDDLAKVDRDNPMKLLIDWRANTPGDYIRVLTEKSPGGKPVPESGLTLSFLTIGLLILIGARSFR